MASVLQKKSDSTLKRNPQQNEFFYTRDMILNLFSLDCPFPADIDESLDAFVDEPRPPLAHLPLSDIEKRLLSMVTINSEANRRTHNYQNKKRDRPERPQGLPTGSFG